MSITHPTGNKPNDNQEKSKWNKKKLIHPLEMIYNSNSAFWSLNDHYQLITYSLDRLSAHQQSLSLLPSLFNYFISS